MIQATEEVTISRNSFLAPDNNDSFELKKFTNFPKLPLELRRKVWTDATPRSRFIEMFAQFQGQRHPQQSEQTFSESYLSPNDQSDIRNYKLSVACDTSFPREVLHTCRESRNEAMRRYCVRLDSNSQAFEMAFDPEDDVLYYFDNPHISSAANYALIGGIALSTAALSSIKHIAVASSLVDSIREYPFKMYTALEDITLVIDPMVSMCYTQGTITSAPQNEFKYLSLSHSNQMEIMEASLIGGFKQHIVEHKTANPRWRVPNVKYATFEQHGQPAYPLYDFDREGGPEHDEGRWGWAIRVVAGAECT